MGSRRKDFTSQRQIWQVAARLVQWSQIHLRRAILENNREELSLALLCLRFPFKHSALGDWFLTDKLMQAHHMIGKYILTGNIKFAQDALKILSEVEHDLRFWAAHPEFARMQPQPGDVGPFYPGIWHNLDRALMEYLPGIAFAWAIASVLLPLSKSHRLLSIAKNRAAIQKAVEEIWRDAGPIIRREAPQLWQQIREIVRSLRIPHP